MDGHLHNTSWEVEHGGWSIGDGISFSACGPVTLEKYLMKCRFISFGRNLEVDGPVILDRD